MSKILKREALRLFKKYRKMADDGDDDAIDRLTQELAENELELVVVQNTEDVTFHDDNGYQFTEVVQTNKLTIGKQIVYEWEITYWGAYGGMGAGWWVEEANSSLDNDVQYLLEQLDYELETPDVPRPKLEAD